MARIAGIDLNKNKNIVIALTYIYGIGISSSKTILNKLNIDTSIKVKDLNEEQEISLRKLIDEKYLVEGELRTQVQLNIKRLIDIGCYRGLRHRRGLPVRGQKTKTNARTRKGSKQSYLTKNKR